MVTISLSSLTPFYRQQLGEVLESIGLDLPARRKPLTVKFVNEESSDTKQRSRSCTPSHNRRPQPTPYRTPTVSRTARSPEPPDSSLIMDVEKFFASGTFKFGQSWRPRKFVLSKLVAMIDSFFTSCTNGEKNFADKVWQFYQDKLGLRSLVEFTILDLVSNALLYRQESMEVDIFVRFIENFFDPASDYEFYIFLRRDVLGPILGAATRGVATLAPSDCAELARKISLKKNLNAKSVMDTIRGEKNVDGVYFIYICLWVFHHQEQPVVSVDSSELIDSYIDSIVSLKNQTKLLRNSAKPLVRDSVNMEEVIGRMLSDCCAERAGSCDERILSSADKLMKAVMNGDHKVWGKLVASSRCDAEATFSQAMTCRDKLLESLAEEKEEGEIESALYEFCVSIANTFTDKEVLKIRAA